MKKISICKLLAGIALSVCAVFCGIVGIKLFTGKSAPQKAYAASDKNLITVNTSLSSFFYSSDGYVYPKVFLTVGSKIADEFGEKSVIISDYTVTKWLDYMSSRYVYTKPMDDLCPEVERYKIQKIFSIVRVTSVSAFTNFATKTYNWVKMQGSQEGFCWFYDSEIPVASMEDGYFYRLNDSFKVSDYDNTDYYYFPCVFSVRWIEHNYSTAIAKPDWRIESTTVTVERMSENYVKLNASEFAKEQLKSSVNDFDLNLSKKALSLYYKIAGYTVPSGKTSVTLQYRTETTNGSGCVSQSLSQYGTAVLIDQLHAFSKTYAWDKFAIAKGLKGISDFNVISTKKSYDSNDPDSAWTMWERPLLTASGYSYTYDPKTNRGVITIEYDQFQAQSFVIQMQNKVNRDTVLYIQSTDIKKVNGKTTIRFLTDRIQTMLANNVNWNVVETNFQNLNITVPDNLKSKVKIHTTESNGVVKSVVVETTDPDLLQYCSVYLPVYEDKTFDYVVTLKFKALSLNKNTDKIELINKQTLFPYSISSNDIYRLSVKNIFNGTGVMEKNGSYDTLLEESISPSFLSGVEYLSIAENSPVEIETHSEASSPYAYVTIPYKVNPLFVIRDVDSSGAKKTENPRFVIVSTTTTSYSGSYFAGDYSGERVIGITCGISDLMREEKNGDVVKDWTFNFNTEYPEDKQIPITVTYSDKLKLKITYLQNYYSAKLDNGKTPTGFAKKCVKSFDENSSAPLSASSFSNIYKPTADELVSALGLTSKDDLTVIGEFGAVDLANTKVVYNDETKGYDMTLAYCATSVKKTNSSGASDFFNVPLTCFADWKKNFNSDWSIQVLNTENKVVFASQADIFESDLYGYFFTSVFSEKVTSLDSLFSCFGSGGCRSFYEMKEIKGSDIYKLCRAQPWLFPVAGGIVGGAIGLFVGHPVIGAGVGAAVGATAEFAVVSIDEFFGDAGTYYTYFSFIDGTSSLPFTSRNGANDYFNNKSATENKVDEINENIKNLLTGDTYIRKILILIGGVLVVLVLVSVVLKFIPVWQKYAARIRENKGTRTKNEENNKRK